MPSVIGVDSSTQSTKVEWRDLDTGTVLATGRAPHPATLPPCSEQDPASWWDALTEAAVLRGGSTPALHPVRALSVAGQQHGLVVLDAEDRVLRPAKLWNDTESASDAAALVAQVGPAAWADACGSVPVAAFTVTKLAWLARHDPALLDRVARVLLPHDWLTQRLTGAFVTDRGDASGTGYWSPAEERWRPDLLELAVPTIDVRAWSDRLPRVLGPTDAAGVLRRDAATQLGLDGHGDEVLVGPGTGDNMAAALGLALEPGDVAISLGTSGTVYGASAAPTADPTGAVAGFADATGRYLPLVCTLNATQVTDTFARLLDVDLRTLDAMAAACPAGAGGVAVVPYLNGERTPNRPAATGMVHGLRTHATREQLARAAFEGVICGLLEGLDALHTAGVITDGRLVLVGGGAKSPRYRQVLADLAQRPVVVPHADELVAAGACVQAAAVATGDDLLDIARRWKLDQGVTVEPDPRVSAEVAAEIRATYAAARG